MSLPEPVETLWTELQAVRAEVLKEDAPVMGVRSCSTEREARS